MFLDLTDPDYPDGVCYYTAPTIVVEGIKTLSCDVTCTPDLENWRCNCGAPVEFAGCDVGEFNADTNKCLVMPETEIISGGVFDFLADYLAIILIIVGAVLFIGIKELRRKR